MTISPPCTLPKELAFEGSIVCEKVVFELATVLLATVLLATVLGSTLPPIPTGANASLQPVSVLSREELRSALTVTPPLVEPLDQDSQLQPNGIDLRIDRVQLLSSAGALGQSDKDREHASREDLTPDDDGWWDLAQGSYVIGFQERVNLPADLIALSRPRSSLLRSGVAVHTGVWDAGYEGRGEALMSVQNQSGYRLQRGARVVQLVFIRLGSAVEEGYRGLYQERDRPR